MKRCTRLPTLLLAVLLTACLRSVDASAGSARASSSPVQIHLVPSGTVHLPSDAHASSFAFTTDQNRVNAMFESKYASLEHASSSSAGQVSTGQSGFSNNGSLNGSVNGNGSWNDNGSVTGQRIGGSSILPSENPSAYSYISGCDQSFLQRLGLRGQCGSPGWEFPGLIGGQCPVTACILDIEGETPFGPL